ncbi:MAG TPA: hypothetical protein VG649_03660 [Candidatus Angelobacter sp.]|nr:hypothetical protein [Candidatus Angelobacter sp.]
MGRSFFCWAGILLAATFGPRLISQQTNGTASATAQQPTSTRVNSDQALAHKLITEHQLLSPQERLQYLRPSKHSGLIPEGDFERKATESPEAHAHRRLKEDSHKGFYQHPIIDPGFLVNGQPETIDLMHIDSVRIDDGSGDTDELPIHESAAIVIGTVSTAQAFVSYHGTSVYSDFQIKVEEVLKRDLAHPVFLGETITGLRTGGSIHFPSGHVTTSLVQGSGFPAVGKQYVFFLTKLNPDLPEYGISLAYELGSTKTVFPINDLINKEFDGMKTAQFMDRLRAGIATRGN